MNALVVVFILMLATVVLAPVAGRLRLPHPVLVTVFGFALSYVPGVPVLRINPSLILPLVLPPLIYAAGRRTSWRQFVGNARAILLLAVALVFVTTAAVAATAWALVPGITLLGAIVLGAVVSPPDPVAAVAVAGPLGLPRRLASVLEGEGLFNDVTALTVYQVTVSAVASGKVSAARSVGLFALAAVGAVIIGLALGRVTLLIQSRLDTPELMSGLSLLMPFAAYEVADRLHCSGVLAVLVVALYLGHFGADASDVEGRLQGSAFWDVVELLVTGFGFGLIGEELRLAVDTLMTSKGIPAHVLVGQAAAVCGVVVGVRALWMLPAAWAAHRRAQGGGDQNPANWRETVVVIWSGMRGVVSVATALALPTSLHNGRPYPARNTAIFISLAVVLVTLVVQGLTLPVVVRMLRVRAPEDIRDAAERALTVRAGQAALRHLKAIAAERDLPEEVVEVLRTRQRAIIAAVNPEAISDTATRAALAERAEQRELRREVEAELLAAAREEVVNARAEPGIDPEAADAVLRRLDLRTMSLL